MVAVLAAVLLSPPAKLDDFVGSETWTRIGLGFVLFLALYLVLAALNITDGKISLPFGFSIDRGERGTADIHMLAALGRELDGLRQADDRIFNNLEELAALLEEHAVRLDDVVSQVVRRDTASSGESRS